MNNCIDVLNLEWTSTSSRDRVAATLVCNYLRMQGLCVQEQSVFDGYHALNKYNPRLFFMADTHGAPENLELMRYAKSRGYLGVSLTSEGNFTRDSKNHLEMIWGWNKQKKLLEDLRLQWSERTRSITLGHHPDLYRRIGVSGGIGFDNYHIEKIRLDRCIFLLSHGKVKYEKVVGVGCFDFGTMYPEDYRYEINLKSFTSEQIQRFRNDGKEFDEVLSTVAKSNQDVLFLVKQHPGAMLGHKASGIEELSTLPNVLVLKNELSIFECISISDFWIIYESTTALEAWIMGKQTCLLNPSGRDFPRDTLVSEGSPTCIDFHEMNQAIESFYSYGELPGFSQREVHRRQTVKQTIQWDDGLNHVRAGNAILDFLEKEPELLLQKETFRQKIGRWKQHIKWILSPFFYQFRHCNCEAANRKNFVNADLMKFATYKLQDQRSFYKLKNLSIEKLRKIQGL